MAVNILPQHPQYSSCHPFTKLWPPSLTLHHSKLSYNNNYSRIVCALNADKDVGRAKEGKKGDGNSLEFSRKEALRRLDLELERGREKEAVSLVTSLQGKPGGLRGFGAANQVPQRLYTLEELRLNKIDATRLLSPVDTTLGAVRTNLQLASIVGGIAVWKTLDLNQLQLLSIVLALLAFGTIDLHEAGHFLIAYLLGVLPKGYTLSSLDAFKKEGSLNVQAGTAFVDFQFLEEVQSGKLSSGTLNKYSCIALAGVATEYLLFGFSEGGLADIQQLDNLLKSLSFTQKKADSQVRWAVLNTVTLLRRHEQARSKLAEAMSFGKSIGECISMIENELMNAKEI